MTTYVDSSALVKEFLDEEDAQAVMRLLAEENATTSRLSFVECRAAVSRARREGRLGSSGEDRALVRLHQVWDAVNVIELDERVAQQAAALTALHPLRAGDAIHLASARSATEGSEHWTFACWDRRLWRAAAESGFHMVPELEP